MWTGLGRLNFCSLPSLYLVSVNLPYDHVWNTAVIPNLVLLVATWISWIRYRNRFVGLFIIDLARFRNVTSLGLFHRCYFGRHLFEFAELVIFVEGLLALWICYMISVTIRRCYKDVNVNSFFPRTARS